MEYLIKIDEFEGPLDLLLHLVKEANIDIHDININEITEQYMEYIHKWEELNIDIASTYLVMAATLMEIKSRSLLPVLKDNVENVEEDDEVSREGLIKKLEDYQKYKEITKDFKALEAGRKDIYTKVPSKLEEMVGQKLVNDTSITVDDLMTAFMKFLERKDLEKPITTRITTKEYSVRKRKADIKNILVKEGKVDFMDLFQEYNKSFLVVTFISILELAKEDDVILKQEANFDRIMIELKVK